MNHSCQAVGLSTNDTATMARVTPTAVTNLRTSPRNRSHSEPTPGVILVSTGKAQVAAQVTPTTLQAASRKWMLPTQSS